MKFDPRVWWQMVRSLGDAAIDLVVAELAALRSDLVTSSRRLGRGLGLMAIAAALLFWTIGLFSLAAVEIVALWWPRWASVLTVAALFLILVALFARWGSKVLGELEAPVMTVRRRWDEHQDWWRERVLEGEALPPAAAPPVALEADGEREQ